MMPLSGYAMDMMLCGVVYLIIVYLMFVLMRKKSSLDNTKGKGGDDGDGGILLPTHPQIDLPPGVLWPDEGPRGGKKIRKEEEEEALV
jgi:hypothetical protein